MPLGRKNNLARMPWSQDLGLEPSFGNFGVAPPLHWGPLSSKKPRVFGGNMDNKELGAGTTTCFPVFADGALFSPGAELRLANGVTLLAKFDGEFASRSSTGAGTGAVRYTW